MISVDKFLNSVRVNSKRINNYELGHDGSDGTCDCVGLIIGALRLAGYKYVGTHGSNYFARYYTHDLRAIDVNNLLEGDVVYKAYTPGQKGYDLPSRYQNSGDLTDYYHIGVVVSVNPLSIWHCSGGGMHYDNKIGNWKFAGEINVVEYKEVIEMKTPYIAKVNTSSGNLYIRTGPSTECSKVGSIPKDTDIIVRSNNDTEWSFIQYNDVFGYANRKYLLPVKELHEDEDQEEEIIAIPVSVAQSFIDILNELILILKGNVKL